MADNLPTVWDADAHTIAKHALLKRYLDAWFPILTRQAARLRNTYGYQSGREILFMDAFAGPGEYSRGEPGSPLIAIEAAMSHEVEFPFPVRILLNEYDDARYSHLCNVVTNKLTKYRKTNNVIVENPTRKDCEVAVRDILSQYKSRGITFGPALVFLDQFGYGAVPMDMVKDILAHSECEVFALLDFRGMNRWISDPSKEAVFDRAFGSRNWIKARDLPSDEQQSALMDEYVKSLKELANVEYVTSFAMFDGNGRLIYRLIFCSNSLRGLEEMKKAMWKVDKTGECRFSDKDNPGQLQLLDAAFDQQWLASELAERLAGKTLSASEIKKFVLVKTPCYLFKEALRKLETGDNSCVSFVRGPNGRKPSTYPDESLDEIILRFEKSLW